MISGREPQERDSHQGDRPRGGLLTAVTSLIFWPAVQTSSGDCTITGTRGDDDKVFLTKPRPQARRKIFDTRRCHRLYLQQFKKLYRW
jgi:hypothetical protein